eukprot:m.31797 g.31797  ORF g.31797 m.31797 type:complete len:831 (+) comp6335_c0_seq1:197-2689(+)
MNEQLRAEELFKQKQRNRLRKKAPPKPPRVRAPPLTNNANIIGGTRNNTVNDTSHILNLEGATSTSSEVDDSLHKTNSSKGFSSSRNSTATSAHDENELNSTKFDDEEEDTAFVPPPTKPARRMFRNTRKLSNVSTTSSTASSTKFGEEDDSNSEDEEDEKIMHESIPMFDVNTMRRDLMSRTPSIGSIASEKSCSIDVEVEVEEEDKGNTCQGNLPQEQKLGSQDGDVNGMSFAVLSNYQHHFESMDLSAIPHEEGVDEQENNLLGKKEADEENEADRTIMGKPAFSQVNDDVATTPVVLRRHTSCNSSNSDNGSEDDDDDDLNFINRMSVAVEQMSTGSSFSSLACSDISGCEEVEKEFYQNRGSLKRNPYSLDRRATEDNIIVASTKMADRSTSSDTALQRGRSSSFTGSPPSSPSSFARSKNLSISEPNLAQPEKKRKKSIRSEHDKHKYFESYIDGDLVTTIEKREKEIHTSEAMCKLYPEEQRIDSLFMYRFASEAYSILQEQQCSSRTPLDARHHRTVTINTITLDLKWRQSIEHVEDTTFYAFIFVHEKGRAYASFVVPLKNGDMDELTFDSNLVFKGIEPDFEISISAYLYTYVDKKSVEAKASTKEKLSKTFKMMRKQTPKKMRSIMQKGSMLFSPHGRDRRRLNASTQNLRQPLVYPVNKHFEEVLRCKIRLADIGVNSLPDAKLYKEKRHPINNRVFVSSTISPISYLNKEGLLSYFNSSTWEYLKTKLEDGVLKRYPQTGPRRLIGETSLAHCKVKRLVQQECGRHGSFDLIDSNGMIMLRMSGDNDSHRREWTNALQENINRISIWENNRADGVDV